MASNKLKIRKTIQSTKEFLSSPGNLKDPEKVVVVVSSLLDSLILISNHLGLNSSNSSKPPSTDPNRTRRQRVTTREKKKPGGQKGHKGSRLEPITNPTIVEEF